MEASARLPADAKFAFLAQIICRVSVIKLAGEERAKKHSDRLTTDVNGFNGLFYGGFYSRVV